LDVIGGRSSSQERDHGPWIYEGQARVDGLVELLISKVIAPQAVTRAVTAIRGNREEYRGLVASVREETGIRPGRAYRRWFERDDTWAGLVSDTPAAYGALVDALDRQLERALHLPGRRPSAQQRRERAEKLVDATLGVLISSLHPSAAVAVSEYRIRRDVDEVRQLLENRESLEVRLAKVPPPAADSLRLLAIADSALAGRLLDALTAPSAPTEAVRALVAEPPPWLQSAPVQAWLALAEVAHAHGAAGLASALFERVADLGFDRARHLARAALAAAAADDLPRAQAMIGRAEGIGGGAPVVPIVSAAIANDLAGLADFAGQFDTLDFSVLSLIGEALLHEKGLQPAIAFYRRAAACYPDFAGLRLRLAELLLAALQEAGPTSAPAARREVRMLALQARDLRRNWRGPSGDAVAVACRLALAFDDPRDALKLGRAPLDGEATAQEAATPAVRRAVFEAALADGQTNLAERLLREVEDPFDMEILSAEFLTVRGMKAEAAGRYGPSGSSGMTRTAWPCGSGLPCSARSCRTDPHWKSETISTLRWFSRSTIWPGPLPTPRSAACAGGATGRPRSPIDSQGCMYSWGRLKRPSRPSRARRLSSTIHGSSSWPPNFSPSEGNSAEPRRSLRAPYPPSVTNRGREYSCTRSSSRRPK
jgi:hypothetical protein